jgi:hypothetical protein
MKFLKKLFSGLRMFKLKSLSHFNIDIILAIATFLFLGISSRMEAQMSSPYDDASIPFESMPEYSTYRQELIRKGWRPTSVESFPVSDTFPELICGNRVCSADWNHTRGSREIMVIVWPDYTSVPSRTIYRVAPAIE